MACEIQINTIIVHINFVRIVAIVGTFRGSTITLELTRPDLTRDNREGCDVEKLSAPSRQGAAWKNKKSCSLYPLAAGFMTASVNILLDVLLDCQAPQLRPLCGLEIRNLKWPLRHEKEHRVACTKFYCYLYALGVCVLAKPSFCFHCEKRLLETRLMALDIFITAFAWECPGQTICSWQQTACLAVCQLPVCVFHLPAQQDSGAFLFFVTG